MIVGSISAPNVFEVWDESANMTCYGCDQAWYPAKRQRLSGCGPATGCNIVFYLTNNHQGSEKISKEQVVGLMEEAWKYITPRATGIPRTDLFYRGAISYARSKGIEIKHKSLEVPKWKRHRPRFAEAVRFIHEALRTDAPVAFLNLDNGGVNALDSWHWVTIISLEYEADGSAAFIWILDQGKIKFIDLKKWYENTKRGGGFVYFQL